jgi:steroid delta-isomerase-like uncharacterized protein
MMADAPHPELMTYVDSSGASISATRPKQCIAGVPGSLREGGDPMSEQHKAIVGRWLDEFWNKGNVAVVDELGAPTMLLYYPLTGELRGRESVKQMIRQFRTAFPDASFSLEGDLIAEGDKVVAHWKGVATQKGAFGGIPATGKSATWTGISIFRIADGKVAEETGEEDALSVLQQLGLVPKIG